MNACSLCSHHNTIKSCIRSVLTLLLNSCFHSLRSLHYNSIIMCSLHPYSTGFTIDLVLSLKVLGDSTGLVLRAEVGMDVR